MKNRVNTILGAIVLVVFLFMTIGYAGYGKVLNLNGVANLKSNGTVQITNINLLESSNLKSQSYTIDGVDVALDVKFNNRGQNQSYYVLYEVTVENGTFYDYEYTGSNYVPNISSDNATVNVVYEVYGVSNGDKIKAGTSLTFQIKISATISSDHTGDIDAGGGFSSDVEEEIVRSLIGSFSDSTTGDLTEENSYASFNIDVVNTYDYNKTFDIILGNNPNFQIINCDGSALSSFTITKNTTASYNFCIKRTNSNMFAMSPQSLSVILRSNGLADSTIGIVSLNVPVDETIDDTEAPVIRNVNVAKTYGEKGKVKITWDGSDENSVQKYYINVYKNGTFVNKYETVGDEESYIFTDIEENTSTNPAEYYFIVYGIDQTTNKNTAKTEEIDSLVSNGTQTCIKGDTYGNSGFACRTGNSTFKWTYSVTYVLDGLNANGAPNTIIEGKTLEATLTAQFFRTVPKRLDYVRMGGQSYTNYTYSNNKVTISEVTGDVEIKATGGNSCLVKGTKVLLADGTYKKIEDVTYYDLLSVWNYDTGQITYTYPAFIENSFETGMYEKTTFSDGTNLKTFNEHGVFSIDKNQFVLTTDKDNFKVGTRVAKIINGKPTTVKIKKIELIPKKVKVYHIVSNGYFNIIAGDVLTTDPNIMISNQYGFVNGIKWPENTRKSIINNKDNLYDYDLFSDIMPYYLFKALRVNEGKYVVNKNMISFDLLKAYLSANPSNKMYFKDLPKYNNGKRKIIITTSLDNLKTKNKQKYFYEEGSYYTLPENKKIKCFLNTTNNTCYKPGSKLKIYTSTHFIAR